RVKRARPFSLAGAGASEGALEQRRDNAAGDDLRFERVAAGVAQVVTVRQRAAGDHQRGDVLRAAPAEGRDNPGQIVREAVAMALYAIVQTLVRGVDGGNRRRPLTEAGPLARAPVQRRERQRLRVARVALRL